MAEVFEFGDYRFDAEKRVLWQAGEVVSLPPKATEVLRLLIENNGNLVERGEILDKVWSDTFVEEANVNYVISLLRKTLGNNGIIQTIPRRGYRFTAPVRNAVLNDASAVLLERRTISHTLIETSDETENGIERIGPQASGLRRYLAAALVAIAVIAGGGFWLSQRSPGARPSVSSIAVLPLKGFSEDADELRLKITDSLITRLGSTDKIVIRPTSSVFRLSDPSLDVIEAGKTLRVDAVLDGHVQQENGRLRVNLQLISITNGDQIWSGQFDGRVNDLLGLQDLIAARFQKDLGLSEGAGFAHPSSNSEAYEAYLKGRFLWNQRKKDAYFSALEFFNRSIELDPNFALGYTGIADCYHLLEQRNNLPMREAMVRSEAAARRALELAPDLPEAHTSMGSVYYILYSRWSDAEREYRKAIELNPNLAEPYARLGMLLNAWARFDESNLVLRKATELDPTSLNNSIYLGANYFFSKQYGLAETQFKQILAFAPDTERAHWFLERTYEMTGMYDQAVEHAARERSITDPGTAESLRNAYRSGGVRAFWRRQIELWTSDSRQMYGLDYRIASRYALLGEAEKACHHVEKNLIEVGSMRYYGRVDPLFDSLRTSDCFKELMALYAPSI